MSVPVVAFFNNKGGVGKTTMVYHLSWMFADLGYNVVAADLDPQSNLTAAFLDEDRLESLVGESTVFGAIKPLQSGIGDVLSPHVEAISDKLGLLLGDMALSSFEDELSNAWPRCIDGNERAFRVVSAFYRVMQMAAESRGADIVLVDLGPNLGAINRAVLIASDYVVIPLGPDLFSLQGLQNLGPRLRDWRDQWSERLEKNTTPDLPLPSGTITPVGYIVLRHSIRLDRPVKAFDRWIARIPSTYSTAVLDEKPKPDIHIGNDPHCIARLKDYRSLAPLAHEARKPMFFLKQADGALGAHTYAVSEAYDDFRLIANAIAQRIGLSESAALH